MLLAVAVTAPSTASVAVALPIATSVVVPVASAFILAGGVTVGAPPSVIVTVCVAVPVLPASSVAVHVTTVTPTGKGPVLSAVTVTEPSTKSVALAAPRPTAVVVPVDGALTSAGASTLGGVLSVTVIVCVAEPELPALSVAVHITVVEPTGNGPLLLAVATSAPSTASLADAEPIGTAVVAPVASTLISAGGTTVGAPLSAMIITCVSVPVLPALSVALQVTVVAPTGNGPVLSATAVNAPSTMSVAVAVPILTAPVEDAFTVAGATTSGGVVSTTAILTVSCALTVPSSTSSETFDVPTGSVTSTEGPLTSPNAPVQVNVSGSSSPSEEAPASREIKAPPADVASTV